MPAGGHGHRAVTQQGYREFFNAGIQLVFRHTFMNQSDFQRLVSGNFFRTEEIATGLARSHGANHIGSDSRRGDAQAGFTQAIAAGVSAHRNIAGSDQTQGTAVGRTLNPADGGLVDEVKHLHQSGQTMGVIYVFLLTECSGLLHVNKICARREMLALAGDDDHATFRVIAGRVDGFGQLHNNLIVEGVALVRPVENNPGDAPGVGLADNGGFGHSIFLNFCSLGAVTCGTRRSGSLRPVHSARRKWQVPVLCGYPPDQ